MRKRERWVSPGGDRGLMERWWRRDRRPTPPPPVSVVAEGDVDTRVVDHARRLIEELVDQARRPVGETRVTLTLAPAGHDAKNGPDHVDVAAARATMSVDGHEIDLEANADDVRVAVGLLERQMRQRLGHRVGRRRDHRRRRLDAAATKAGGT